MWEWLWDHAIVLAIAFKFGTLFGGHDLEAERLEQVTLPPGFAIEVFAQRLPNARSMALGSDGTLYVGTMVAGNVYVVPNDGRKAGDARTLLSGLTMPNGVAVRDGALYVAEMRRVWRYDGIASQGGKPTRRTLVRDGFPGQLKHGWKFIRFGPDGRLYVPRGSRQDDDVSGEQEAAILRMHADGSGLEVFARGIRNTVGFDWDPATHELWFTENGRDGLAFDRPPDEIDHAPRAGLHFGFPYCHGDTMGEGKHRRRPCSDFEPPAAKLDPHAAALGMRFYTGTMFPPEWRDGFFFAEHGSWDCDVDTHPRDCPTGYDVRFARVRDGKVVEVKVLASGFYDRKARKHWGRPVDVEVMPDGALLVSDDYANAIYRISYRAP